MERAPAPPPFVVIEPSAPSAPVLFDSPHSGRAYPPDWRTACSRAELRRGEDACVDELLAGAPAHGVTLLLATSPRCYLDLNRDPDDLDPAMLDGPWPGGARPSEKSLRGLGLIRRYVVPGVAVVDGVIAVAEVQRRLDTIYAPYHAELARRLEAMRAAHGVAWLVDWHSMKSVGNAMTPDGAGARRPDAVVGDLDGRSTGPALRKAVVEALRGAGLTVALNAPYRGGAILRRHARPEDGIHAVQVELNRGLYLDEVAVEKTAGFAALVGVVEEVAREVAGAVGRGARLEP